MIDGFTCEKTPKALVDWVQQKEEPGHCPPCLVKPLAQNYLGKLEEAKAEEQMKELRQAWDSSDALTIAKAMDRIKAQVGDNLKKDLLELDCFAQSYRD